ncbi:hypothetical protein B0A49_07074 [Cryomyces minteri]|uniref:RBR-type E3 ubiquitin transferase n=1 Tax=Cryomyces minteri TaxID=331657 RepID=A0A4U0WWG6_9PEZI|nr:hypothetical protein B0A49_07074 [Cryomyces minteri]
MAAPAAGCLDNLDEQTAALALQLQLEDVDALLQLSQENPHEGEVSDADVALQLYKQELEDSIRRISDRSTARLTEGGPTAAHDEGNPRLDAILAPELAEQEIAEPRETCEDQSLPGDAGTEPSLSPTDPEANEENTASEVSAPHHCVVCQEGKEAIHVVPCQHEYCLECLEELFRISMTDESLFPPRCCRQPIPLHTVAAFLPAHLVPIFETKKVEFGTVNRTYCSSPACSAFIHAQAIDGDVAKCQACSTTTCVICKAAAHSGDCPNDEALQQLLETATTAGWQRCQSCRRFVELNHGCNHITCICSAQFCYLCGAPWKTCACPQWNEERLLARANQIVARNAAVGGIGAAVAAMAQDLLEGHECDHDRWRRVTGEHDCEECFQTLRRYIYECRQCHLRVCHRCRDNRI